jgi:two-component system chemotaxis response regulator CheB
MMINGSRAIRDIIVIGGSAGGLEALISLLGALPHDLPATIAVVLHRSPVLGHNLSNVLRRATVLSLIEVDDAEPLRAGRVYLAPRDRHLRFDDGMLGTSRDAHQHRFRPAVDPLFMSAASVHGDRVVGVLLSGGGEDGVPGLIAIKAAGGLSLVQDPREATAPMMPMNAIEKDDVDGILKISDLATALCALANGRAWPP